MWGGIRGINISSTIHTQAAQCNIPSALVHAYNYTEALESLILYTPANLHGLPIGWSCVSSTLRDKITTMKQKASMVKELESLCRSYEDQVKDYQSHLDAPLPPSVLLESIHADTRERAVSTNHHYRTGLHLVYTFFVLLPVCLFGYMYNVYVTAYCTFLF